jgi:copper oxidase (laccase) domain-containing protein
MEFPSKAPLDSVPEANARTSESTLSEPLYLLGHDVGLDTYSDERFYSYRRSVHRGEPDYGRHVHAIVLEGE